MNKIYIVLFFLSVNFLFAQNYQATEKSSLNYTLKGKIIDKLSSNPLEYATVSIKSSVNEMVGGTVTDFDGNFEFSNLKAGIYSLEVSFLGFKSKVFSDIKIEEGVFSNDLGKLKLSEDVEAIDEIEVTAMRSSVKYEIDKKVISVDKQIVAGSGTAIDVLESVPSVQVDINGDVSLRGSTNFTVFINGRLSPLDANEALRQIPASLIENIEIITNPSAKFDAEGTAGIINIILKKERQSGVSGSVSARAGNFGNYGGDAVLSVNAKKFTFLFSGNYGRSPRPSFYDSDLINQFGDTTFTTTSTSERERTFIRLNGKIDVEYRPDDNNTITVGGTVGRWSMDVGNDVDFELSNSFTPEVDRFNSFNETDRYSFYYMANIDYSGTFKDKHKVSFHTSYRGREDNEFIYNYQNRGGDIFFGTKSSEIGPAQRLRMNIDYEFKIDENTALEFGALNQYNATFKEARSFLLDVPEDEFIEQIQFNQDIDFSLNIRAFYGQFRTKYKKFGFQVGLRTENTQRNIKVAQDNTEFPLNRLDFFPSAYASFNQNDYNQFYVNYSRRIQQPRGWFLEPNRVFQDAFTYWQGDPALTPTFIDSYEGGWIRNFKKKGSFAIEAYYRYETNTIEIFSAPFEENTVIRRPANAGIAHNAGVEPRLNYPFFKWWEIDASANLFYLRVKGSLREFEFDRSRFTWIASLNNFFAITKNTKFQFDGRYFSPRVMAQGRTSGYFSFNLGLRQDFFNRNLSISVQLRNAFGTVFRETFTDLDNYYFYEMDIPRWPQFFVNINYRFNNFKPKRPDGEGGGEF